MRGRPIKRTLRDERLQRLQDDLRANTYRPQPVLRHLIPKAGQPGIAPAARYPDDLRSGLPAGAAQQTGTDL